MRKDVEQMALQIGERLNITFTVEFDNIGGYRLCEKGGSTGFAYNNGMEPRMSHKEFMLYLQGIRDCLDHLELRAKQ
jgi:hypothetical protein